MGEDAVASVERWGVYEVELTGPADGNPFVEVELSARFQYRNRYVDVDGFYDGNGRYRIRFMPDQPGEWTYRTVSSAPALDGVTGEFVCVPAGEGNHGPVRADGTGFVHADGTPHFSFGTTCYHWTHQEDEAHEELTLRALATSPYNKVRMCVLPTSAMRPPRLPFVGDTPGQLDKTRFDPAFFAHFERRVADLLELGIEADIILFHPYDKGHWGVDDMSREEDCRFLRYVIARLAAYRNVWWSVSNEFDFNKAKTMDDWDHLARFVQRCDPYQRLRSIHNGTKMYEYSIPYDFTKPWVTHQSVQHWSGEPVTEWLAACAKPVVIDEIGYEGNIDRRWGNLTAQELVERVWEGTARGGFVGHGECFWHKESGPWISVGGDLYGESTKRIAFLRELIEARPSDRLEYFGSRQPAYAELDLPEGESYAAELIDTWAMTVTPLAGVHQGPSRIPLPRRTYLALRLRKVAG
jgi:hypothetical protein